MDCTGTALTKTAVTELALWLNKLTNRMMGDFWEISNGRLLSTFRSTRGVAGSFSEWFNKQTSFQQHNFSPWMSQSQTCHPKTTQTLKRNQSYLSPLQSDFSKEAEIDRSAIFQQQALLYSASEWFLFNTLYCSQYWLGLNVLKQVTCTEWLSCIALLLCVCQCFNWLKHSLLCFAVGCVIRWITQMQHLVCGVT